MLREFSPLLNLNFWQEFFKQLIKIFEEDTKFRQYLIKGLFISLKKLKRLLMKSKEHVTKRMKMFSREILLKITAIINDVKAKNAIVKIKNKTDKLQGSNEWRLRNVLMHGYPYYLIVNEYKVLSPILSKEVILEDLEKYISELHEILQLYKETIYQVN